jgi:hypothetical protein
LVLHASRRGRRFAGLCALAAVAGLTLAQAVGGAEGPLTRPPAAPATDTRATATPAGAGSLSASSSTAPPAMETDRTFPGLSWAQ